jgi:hypothetical protein
MGTDLESQSLTTDKGSGLKALMGEGALLERISTWLTLF